MKAKVTGASMAPKSMANSIVMLPDWRGLRLCPAIRNRHAGLKRKRVDAESPKQGSHRVAIGKRDADVSGRRASLTRVASGDSAGAWIELLSGRVVLFDRHLNHIRREAGDHGSAGCIGCAGQGVVDS